MPKKTALIFESLSQNQARRYSNDFKHLPEIRNQAQAEKAIEILNELYAKYRHDNDRRGLERVFLSAEIAQSQSFFHGLPEAERMFREWLNNKAR